LQLLESSEQAEEPTTFEVGAGDIVGDRLFEVRGKLWWRGGGRGWVRVKLL